MDRLLEACSLLIAEGFVGAVDKPAHVPAIDEFVRGFAGGVMAARQHARLKVETILAEGVDDLERVLAGEGEIVIGVDEQDFLLRPTGFGSGKFWIVVAGTDGGP